MENINVKVATEGSTTFVSRLCVLTFLSGSFSQNFIVNFGTMVGVQINLKKKIDVFFNCVTY